MQLSALAEFVRSPRQLFKGGPAQYQGSEIRLTWGKAEIPIYMAAHGAKTLEVAGQIADGVIVGTGVGDNIVRDAFLAIANGARRTGRKPEPLDIWWHLGAYAGHSRRQALAQIRSNLAPKVNHLLSFPNERKYMSPEYKRAWERIHKEYNYLEHLKPGPDTKNTRLVEESGIEDYLADRYAIIDNPEECLETLQRLGQLGVTKIWLSSKRLVKFGALGPGNSTSAWPHLLRAVLGLPISVVEGFKGTSELRLAAESGEIEGACWGWDSIKVMWAEGVESGFVRPVIQTMPEPHLDLPTFRLLSSKPRQKKDRTC